MRKCAPKIFEDKKKIPVVQIFHITSLKKKYVKICSHGYKCYFLVKSRLKRSKIRKNYATHQKNMQNMLFSVRAKSCFN